MQTLTMRTLSAQFAVPLALLALSACGQSGDLYRPGSKPPPVVAAPMATVAPAPEEKKQAGEEEKASPPATPLSVSPPAPVQP